MPDLLLKSKQDVDQEHIYSDTFDIFQEDFSGNNDFFRTFVRLKFEHGDPLVETPAARVHITATPGFTIDDTTTLAEEGETFESDVEVFSRNNAISLNVKYIDPIVNAFRAARLAVLINSDMVLDQNDLEIAYDYAKNPRKKGLLNLLKRKTQNRKYLETQIQPKTLDMLPTWFPKDESGTVYNDGFRLGILSKNNTRKIGDYIEQPALSNELHGKKVLMSWQNHNIGSNIYPITSPQIFFMTSNASNGHDEPINAERFEDQLRDNYLRAFVRMHNLSDVTFLVSELHGAKLRYKHSADIVQAVQPLTSTKSISRNQIRVTNNDLYLDDAVEPGSTVQGVYLFTSPFKKPEDFDGKFLRPTNKKGRRLFAQHFERQVQLATDGLTSSILFSDIQVRGEKPMLYLAATYFTN